MTAQFSHIHASGKFPDPKRYEECCAEFKAALEEFLSMPGVKVVTGTEARKFAALLPNDDQWGHFIGDGECYVVWAKDTFEPAWKSAGHADRIGTPFFRGGNKDARTPLTSMPLRHLAIGRVVMVRAAHLPAHIQDGDGFRKTTARVIGQGRAWVSSMAAMGKRSRRFGANHKDAAEIICGDFNVDVHRAHWRAVVTGALGLSCATPIPDGGDLGKRLVSWFFYRGLGVATTAVMRSVKGFDHRPVLIRWTIKEK